MTITEHIGTNEQVIVVVREEGTEMKPDNMQCVAQSSKKGAEEGDRCPDDKSFDEETDVWMVTCEFHTKRDKAARLGKGESAQRVA